MEWWGFLFVWKKGKRKAKGKYDHIDRLLCRIFSQKNKKVLFDPKNAAGQGRSGSSVQKIKNKIRISLRKRRKKE